jgi:hypothetical protein
MKADIPFQKFQEKIPECNEDDFFKEIREEANPVMDAAYFGKGQMLPHSFVSDNSRRPRSINRNPTPIRIRLLPMPV